jgi:signal transduction histidine kinase
MLTFLVFPILGMAQEVHSVPEPVAATAASTPLTPWARPGCDSCKLKVSQLDKPFSLVGKWLFTRDDELSNKDINLDTSNWKLVRTPGPWKNAYKDGKNFKVGWYRGEFEFAPALIGQEVVLLIDPYMARTQIYLDGVEVFRRPGNINVDRYFSLQPIPVRFKVSQARHVLAVRVDSWLMTGIYQLPFEMHRFDPHDISLAWYQYRAMELRFIAGAITLTFGMFFMLIFFRTRYGMYLFASASCLAMAPHFVLPTDPLLRIFEPESLFFLHYPGLIFGFFLFKFSQYFHTFTPRLNWILGTFNVITTIILFMMVFYPNLDVFLKIRSVHLGLLLINGLLALYMVVNGALNKRPGAALLSVGMLVFLTAGVNDLLLALGKIESTAVMYMGAFFMLSAQLYVASTIFANTFRENFRLLAGVRQLNDNLEDMVAERTRELDVAVQGLGAANQSLSTSYEQLKVAQQELVRSEKLAALGALVAGIAHELNTPLGNGLMAITTLYDETRSLRKDMATVGLRKSSLDKFISTVEEATDITLLSLNRSSLLVSSFKQIAVDQTSESRSQFNLNDLLKDVLTVLQPTFKSKPYQLKSQVDTQELFNSYPGPLGQVLTNLILNAIIHGFDGRAHGLISLSAQNGAPGWVTIKVSDDGRGIEEAHLPKIFDPFFTTKLGQGGSGLGLHIVHNIVTQVLGGTLTVSTQVGVGTAFTMELPLHAHAAPAASIASIAGTEVKDSAKAA